MQDYNTIIGAIQMRLNKCPTRSVMDRFRIGSSTLNLIMSRYIVQMFIVAVTKLKPLWKKWLKNVN